MLIKNPFFSIVIPTRNRADTLKYTIKTILNQDFQDYEIIICNNNSVDDTEEIVKKFSDKRRSLSFLFRLQIHLKLHSFTKELISYVFAKSEFSFYL